MLRVDDWEIRESGDYELGKQQTFIKEKEKDNAHLRK